MAYQKKVTVFVWDEPHVVSVYREHQGVWVAVGDYEGKSISVQDRSEGAAMPNRKPKPRQPALTAEAQAASETHINW